MSKQDQRQNVLVIMCDQLRPDFLSAYGADFIPTPNLDALAADGVVFDQCARMYASSRLSNQRAK